MHDAERAFRSALALAKSWAISLLAARANNNLASASHLRGRADEALGLYRGALLSYQRLGDRRGAAESYHNLGLVFRGMAYCRKPRTRRWQRSGTRNSSGERGLLALAVTGRAELMVEPASSGTTELEGARAVRRRKRDDPIGVAEARRVRARAALRRGDYAAAVQQAEAAYAIAGERGAALLPAESAAMLALAFRADGNPAADARRRQVLTSYRALGAGPLAERFEHEWETFG